MNVHIKPPINLNILNVKYYISVLKYLFLRLWIFLHYYVGGVTFSFMFFIYNLIFL